MIDIGLTDLSRIKINLLHDCRRIRPQRYPLLYMKTFFGCRRDMISPKATRVGEEKKRERQEGSRWRFWILITNDQRNKKGKSKRRLILSTTTMWYVHIHITYICFFIFLLHNQSLILTSVSLKYIISNGNITSRRSINRRDLRIRFNYNHTYVNFLQQILFFLQYINLRLLGKIK